MRRLFIILAICILSIATAIAQEKQSWAKRSAKKVGTYIDTLANKNIDPRYIQVPTRPWQVVLKFNANDMDMRSTSKISEQSLKEYGYDGEVNVETKLMPTLSSSIGAWVGYRGYGLGFSLSLSGNKGSHFSLGAMGANYGINLRTRRFTTREMNVNFWGWEDGEKVDYSGLECEAYDDIAVRTFFLDGYYMLNGKHFSYAAAYDQSVVQVRSAGSLIIGAMWMYSSLNYANRLNALFIQTLDNVGRLQIHEGCVGVGYAYNWVPVKNLLINVMAIPMLAFFNRTKAYIYDSNYSIWLDKDEKGKKAVPDDDSWTNDVTLTEVDSKVKYGKLSFNFDTRMSITYNWDRYFFNVYGQWNHMSHQIDDTKLKQNEWLVNASIGIRL